MVILEQKGRRADSKIRYSLVNNMQETPKAFKSPPKRFQPRGLSILYEDHDILVVDKVNGLLTVSNEKVNTNTAYYLLVTVQGVWSGSSRVG